MKKLNHLARQKKRNTSQNFDTYLRLYRKVVGGVNIEIISDVDLLADENTKIVEIFINMFEEKLDLNYFARYVVKALQPKILSAEVSRNNEGNVFKIEISSSPLLD